MNPFIDQEDDIEQARRFGKFGSRHTPGKTRIDATRHAALIAVLAQRQQIRTVAHQIIDALSFPAMVEALKLLAQVADSQNHNDNQKLLARFAAARIRERITPV